MEEQNRIDETTKLFEDELREYSSRLLSIAVSRILIVGAVMILVAGSLRVQYAGSHLFWMIPFFVVYVYATFEGVEIIWNRKKAREALFELTRIELMKSLKLKSSPSNESQSNS